ncbi:ABC transporter ATP-binding protein [Bittarella massiliensis (ex Durand et al. 2017)]|uniref:ABC transporter ATP-binding protein n=1 Tax=Bittarella massiliensis (ex Durand et al. 2017) TaxID=1720313 RepID=UPI001AA19869|nr:ABC transporter ATP-binding protein [Bittarella massiliensis (ex Durand et al. 2017)]
MRTVLSYLRPSAKKMAWGITIKFLGTVMDLFLPWILAFVIDTVVPRRSLAQIALWGGVMFLCSVLAVVGNIAANRSAARIARDTSERIRHDLFSKTARLSCRQIDHFTVPSLEARLTTDTYNVHQMLNMMQRVGIRAPILLLGGVAVTLTLEPVLTLVLLSVLPLIALVVFFVSRKGVGLFSAMQRSVDTLVRTVREDVTGIRIIKALSRTEGEKARFDGVNRAVSRRETAASTTMALSNPAIDFFLGAGLTGVILVGAFRVDSGLTQPGAILAFLSYFTIILGAMLSITRVFVMYSKGAASAARIQEVLAAEGEPETLAATPDRGQARLSFEGVTFSYGGGEPAVEDISFAVEPGQTLGIIGATGSGKSTLCNLMLRFYTPDKGVIRLDGRDIRAIPLKELRNRFGVVFQNDLLFGRTVAENIDFDRGIAPGRAAAAAGWAQADFVAGLEGGFAHPLAARGTDLSGGQRQRLLVARALAGDPDILILDDASSALDYQTDARLRQAVREHCADATCVVVAQRVSSVMGADQILVLDEGRLLGCGSHSELLESCPPYRELYALQMGEGAAQ